MDLTIDIEDYKLNIRAGVIITHNDKILAHKSINDDYYALMGGRVTIGENSEHTIKREIFEELGKEIEITGYFATIENFFEHKGAKYHEIMFVYLAEFVNDEDKHIEETIKNIEGRDYLRYEWLDLKEIDSYNFRPVAVKDVLKQNKRSVHVYNDDTKKIRKIY